MATSTDLALWDAVAVIKSAYSNWEAAKAADEEGDDEPIPEYEPEPTALADLDAALAAGADPNRPLSYEEFRHWNQNKVISVAPDLYPLPEEYRPEGRGHRIMTPRETWEYLRAEQGDNIKARFREPFSPEEYRAWYEVNVKPMRFWVLFEALDIPQVLAKLLAAGASPDIQEPVSYGDYPLHSLIRNYFYFNRPGKIIRMLLAAGANVNACNLEGQTALQVGCWDKSLGGLLDLLLRHGASASAIDDEGNTALHAAGFYDEGYKHWPLDDNEEQRADPYDTYYGKRSEDTRLWGAREAVNALVDAGADPNAVNPITGYTPMHWGSVFHGYPHLEFLEALLERGGEVCLPDHDGILPLDIHFEDDDTRGLELLHRFNESLRAPTRTEAATPQDRQFRLWKAVVGNHLADVEAALAEGASANRSLSTAEMKACIRAGQGLEAVPDPAGSGASPVTDVTEPDPSVTTHYAIFRALDKPEILRRLLAAGADPNVTGYAHGYAPLHMLASGRFARPAAAAAALLAAGAKVNQLDREGRTPLQTACKNRADGALISLLLRHGASVDHRDTKGLTALDYATMKNSRSDIGQYYCRWWVVDEYSPDDSRSWVKRIFAHYEDPWTQNDAERALRDSYKT